MRESTRGWGHCKSGVVVATTTYVYSDKATVAPRSDLVSPQSMVFFHTCCFVDAHDLVFLLLLYHGVEYDYRRIYFI